MRKAVLFDEFSYQCPFFDENTDVNNGYGCNHPSQKETQEIDGKEYGCCFGWSCPLGTIAEQQDLDNPDGLDSVSDAREIDWDGLDEDGEIEEDAILLIRTDKDASDDEKEALESYKKYMSRYSY